MSIKQVLQHRRTIRKYKEESIPPNSIEALLDLATRAPTAGNLQNYHIVITSEVASRNRLAKIHGDSNIIYSAPTVLTFFADISKTRNALLETENNVGFDNLWALNLAISDTHIIASTAALLAEEMGFGTCYLGTTGPATSNLIDFFGCPKYVLPVLTLTVGIPDEEPDQSPRFPLDRVASHERYKSGEPSDHLSTAETRLREKYRTLPGYSPENTVQSIYTRLKYPAEFQESESQNWLKTLETQGFLTNSK